MKQVKDETQKIQKEISDLNDGHRHFDENAEATKIEEAKQEQANKDKVDQEKEDQEKAKVVKEKLEKITHPDSAKSKNDQLYDEKAEDSKKQPE